MALSGLQIYKLLPQDQLQGVRLSHLPGLCHEARPEGRRARRLPVRERRGAGGARRRLGAAHPPRRRRRPASARFEVGNEVVLFRHEKTFYHQPGLVVRLRSDDAELAALRRPRRPPTRSSASA